MTKKPLKKVYHASIYLRLSKEDGDVTSGSKNESNSISNQKSLVMDYLKDKHDIQVVSIREDDGYSGVDFNRPGFQLMLEDVKKGIIDCIIVKDLSRFGRNYIEVGRYLEKLFPMLGVRFIAVNDNYDSLEVDTAHDIVMPFKNLINDSYCRDLSVKIRSHLAVKRKNGEFIGAFACYGYLKDPENKNHLVIDTYAGPVVQDIFRMKINGYSQYKIADTLNEQGILSPMEYKRSIGVHFETSFKVNTKALWSAKAVSRILTNEVYTGVLVQGKQTTPNHKVKVRQAVEEKDWIRVENAHAPLIDSCLFESVQTLLGRDTRTSPKADAVYTGVLVQGKQTTPNHKVKVRQAVEEKDWIRVENAHAPLIDSCLFESVQTLLGRDTRTSPKADAVYECGRHKNLYDYSCPQKSIHKKDLDRSVEEAIRYHIQLFLNTEQVIAELNKKTRSDSQPPIIGI